MLLDKLERFVARTRAGNDLDIVFHLQQCRKRAENHGLIFGEDDSYLVALGTRHAASFAERRRLGRAVIE